MKIKFNPIKAVWLASCIIPFLTLGSATADSLVENQSNPISQVKEGINVSQDTTVQSPTETDGATPDVKSRTSVEQ